MGRQVQRGAGDKMESVIEGRLSFHPLAIFLVGPSLPYLIEMRGVGQLCQEFGVRRAVFKIQG